MLQLQKYTYYLLHLLSISNFCNMGFWGFGEQYVLYQLHKTLTNCLAHSFVQTCTEISERHLRNATREKIHGKSNKYNSIHLKPRHQVRDKEMRIGNVLQHDFELLCLAAASESASHNVHWRVFFAGRFQNSLRRTERVGGEGGRWTRRHARQKSETNARVVQTCMFSFKTFMSKYIMFSFTPCFFALGGAASLSDFFLFRPCDVKR